MRADDRVADLVRAGRVRVGLGLGTPALALRDPESGTVRGPALDLARAFAAGIGVDLVNVEYPRPGAVIDGARTGAWDVAFLVMDAARTADVDFSSPYLRSDFTYLVPAGSPLRAAADADRPGMRIAVPRGDASDLRLTQLLRHAELVRTDSLAAAVDLLRTGGAHARAAPRPVLLAEADRLSGSRVLDDGFAAIAYAALVPRGHAARLAFVNGFIAAAVASGLVRRAVAAAGLRGVAPADDACPPAVRPSPPD